ncbi:MAG: phospholipase D-like domain-containing protein, partial [Balneolaceae bacterium]
MKQRLTAQFFLFLFLFLLSRTGYAAESDTSSVEWVQIYFNMPIDSTVAKAGNFANAEADLLQTLIERIDAAKYSIDLAIYNLENHLVGEALVRAKERGVRVRIVTDHYNRFRSQERGEAMWNMLRDAGIYSIDDGGDVFNPDGTVTSHHLVGASYDMHHKFAVIDILSNNPDDYYVWTGSMNLTYTGPINSNNTILIKDSDIAEAYYNEFNQLWGGDGDLPDPTRARYHKDKQFIGENVFYIDSTKVEVYFGPINRDGTKPSIGARLNELIRDVVQQDVNFLAFAITPDIPLSQTMWERSFTDEIYVQGLIDPRFYARYRNTGAIWATPEAQLGNRNIRAARELRTLHHKTMLFDVTRPFDNDLGIAVAGSYNYSNNAEQNNDENLLIFHNHKIANQYYQDFSGAMKRSLGEMDPPVPPIDENEWYDVAMVHDGSRFEINLIRGLDYPVRPLGVQVPRMYAGNDSSEYHAGEAAVFLSELIENKEVKIIGYDGGKPEARNGAYRGYIQVRDRDGNISDVNKELLDNGYGEWVQYYRQHRDSVAAFQRSVSSARSKGVGMWAEAHRVGERIAQVELGEDSEQVAVRYPININTADNNTLQALTGIGPAFAERIVQYRQKNGGFNDVEELIDIRGIGPAT